MLVPPLRGPAGLRPPARLAGGGHFRIAPREDYRVSRRYVEGTNVLETTFETETGTVVLTDAVFDYGLTSPRLEQLGDGLAVVYGGADALALQSRAAARGRVALGLHGRLHPQRGRGCVRRAHVLASARAGARGARAPRGRGRIAETIEWWQEWSSRCAYDGPDREQVVRSALVLKALTNAPTGAIVAAATTSLPEEIGGERNWDYRYSWLPTRRRP